MTTTARAAAVAPDERKDGFGTITLRITDPKRQGAVSKVISLRDLYGKVVTVLSFIPISFTLKKIKKQKIIFIPTNLIAIAMEEMRAKRGEGLKNGDVLTVQGSFPWFDNVENFSDALSVQTNALLGLSQKTSWRLEEIEGEQRLVCVNPKTISVYAINIPSQLQWSHTMSPRAFSIRAFELYMLLYSSHQYEDTAALSAAERLSNNKGKKTRSASLPTTASVAALGAVAPAAVPVAAPGTATPPTIVPVGVAADADSSSSTASILHNLTLFQAPRIITVAQAVAGLKSHALLQMRVEEDPTVPSKEVSETFWKDYITRRRQEATLPPKTDEDLDVARRPFLMV